MGTNSILCVVVGLLIIVVRGPLLFAPERTVLVYQRLTATDARVRGLGLVLGALAVAILSTAVGEETVASLLRLLGVVLIVATL